MKFSKNVGRVLEEIFKTFCDFSQVLCFLFFFQGILEMMMKFLTFCGFSRTSGTGDDDIFDFL